MKTIDLKDILSIAGKGGLYKFIAQARNGIVVESLDEQKRHIAPATARVSSLEDIAIFTEEEEIALGDIFKRLHDHYEGKEALSHKASATELKKAFEELVPEYDEERVYVSDIKKVYQWYNQLQAKDMLTLIDKEEGDEVPEAGEKAPESEAPETPEAEEKE
jgi:crotonobetainyl-CoA:carnitine CoA-transferase CaiB-like acyl-CoA transferase